MCEHIEEYRLICKESPGPDSIKRSVSRYANKVVYDKQLVHYLGVNTYCRLRRMEPSLWSPFPNCVNIHDGHDEVESIVYEFGYSPKQVKKQIVASLATGKKTLLAERLICSSLPPFKIETTLWVDVVWVVTLFVLTFSIVIYVVYSGIFNSLFNQKYGYFSGNRKCMTQTKFCKGI